MPLQADESVRWACGDDEQVIPTGQAWLVDGWRGYVHTNPAR